MTVTLRDVGVAGRAFEDDPSEENKARLERLLDQFLGEFEKRTPNRHVWGLTVAGWTYEELEEKTRDHVVVDKGARRLPDGRVQFYAYVRGGEDG